jgi:hypothetical protein
MRISHTYVLLEQGDFSNTAIWSEAREGVLDSVRNVYWPPGNDEFLVSPEENGNGVNPITEQFEANLDKRPHWESTGRKWLSGLLEERGILGEALEKMGEYYDDPLDFISSPWFDAMKEVEMDGKPGLIVAEWETGNISSSHRSLNRITLGLVSGIIHGGLIVLPNRELYHYLTDRIGNYRELKPYFIIWESLAHEVENGIIEVVVVEHDGVSDSAPPIGKLTDGMSDREVAETGKKGTNAGDEQAGLKEY